jgi:5-methylcytosine-specific restriction endonuclease McrA
MTAQEYGEAWYGKRSNNGFNKIVTDKLIEEKIWIKECTECGLGNIWNNKTIILQVDHIDGNRRNNLITNLRLLCPNCHSQTDTWGSKKRQSGTII